MEKEWTGPIGNIGNYYGDLYIMQYKDKYYWIIEDHSSDFQDLSEWEEINKDLYDNLISHWLK